MAEIGTVSIKFKTGTYAIFRNLQNKAWYAIGEYVDNAVQSYENNKALLKNLHRSKYQFEVKITIDWEEDFIRIYDNAGGIDEKNFPRAFEPANIPTDNSGLHEFGMGMKTASIWLSEVWNVRTAALHETVERSVEFDLKKVLKEEKEVLKVKSIPKKKDVHFTEISLRGLTRNAPNSYQLGKLRSHLASIYRKFIRSGELNLYINNELQVYNDPEILNAPPTTNLNGKSVLWRKEINFKLGNHKATGFVALLNELSTNEHNGFSLFRRGRVIEGSHDEKYRPKVLCGQVGSPRHKRLFGELELEGFEVSFNKGSFQEEGDIEAFMEALKIELSKKDFNLLKQADEYRKPKGKEDVGKVAKSLVSALKKDKVSKPMRQKIETSIEEIENKSLADNNTKLLKKAKAIDIHEETFKIKETEFRLKMELINEPSISDLYTLQIEEKSTFLKTAIFKINLSHPFFTSFDLFKKEDDYKPIILIIRSLVMAEIHSQTQGTKNGGNIRTNFNTFLRNI